jgi:hypothetical protein
MPHRPLLQAATRTDATPRPRRGHRRTTSRTSRSAPSPDNRTAHRQATRPDTSAPGPRSPLLVLPSAHLMPPFYACLSQVHSARAKRRDCSKQFNLPPRPNSRFAGRAQVRDFELGLTSQLFSAMIHSRKKGFGTVRFWDEQSHPRSFSDFGHGSLPR